MSNLIQLSVKDGAFSVHGTQTFEKCIDPLTSPSSDHSVGHSMVASWKFDGRCLRVSSDRLGLIPVFVYQHDNTIAVSDDLARLLSVIPSQKLDTAALSIFLRLGFFLGNDTPFQNVTMLPPATTLHWRGDEIRLEENDYAPPARREESREVAVAEYERLFASSMARRVANDQRITLPLSGGRDSRHILFELARIGHLPIETITAGRPGPGSDLSTASRLAAHFGLENRVVEITNSRWIEREREKNRLTHCLSYEHGWYLGVQQAMHEDANIVYDGIGGDVLSNGLFFDGDLMMEMKCGRFVDAARRLLVWTDSIYLRKKMRTEISYEVAVARLARELARHGQMPDPVKSFYFWNRTRREIALSPICIAALNRQISLPYLDAELFDFLMGLPGERFGRPGFHDETIRKVNPIEIPYSSKAADGGSVKGNARMTARILHFLFLQRGLQYCDLRFALPRIARAALFGGGQELWWIADLIYLESTRKCSGGRLEM